MMTEGMVIEDGVVAEAEDMGEAVVVMVDVAEEDMAGGEAGAGGRTVMLLRRRGDWLDRSYSQEMVNVGCAVYCRKQALSAASRTFFDIMIPREHVKIQMKSRLCVSMLWHYRRPLSLER
jgi:hypothetical protein